MPTLTQQLATLTDTLADEAAADAGNEGYEAHFAGLQARQDAREMAA